MSSATSCAARRRLLRLATISAVLLATTTSSADSNDSLEAFSLGLRLQTLTVRKTDADGSTLGATITSGYARYLNREILTARGVERLAIGGGTGGLEGGLMGDLAIGGRASIAQGGAVVFRGGLRGWYEGNDTLLWSGFELPQVQIGYQRLTGDVLFEIAARGGLLLDGRYSPGHLAVRRLGGAFEFGGYAALRAGIARADVTFMHAPSGTSYTAPGGLDAFEGRLCAALSVLLVCGDARFIKGAVTISPTDQPSATAASFGLLIALEAERRR